MRIQEIHPALVHFPIALVPTALAADALGRVTGNEALMQAGKRLMPVAAASAAISGLFGLVAQEAVDVEGEAEEMLITHRNLNLGLIALTAVMATRRQRRKRPSLAYLLAGAMGSMVMSYSAYLGGHMVYELGVGVKPAGGLLEGEAPEVKPGSIGEAARTSAAHLRDGAVNTAKQTAQGRVAPELSVG